MIGPARCNRCGAGQETKRAPEPMSNEEILGRSLGPREDEERHEAADGKGWTHPGPRKGCTASTCVAPQPAPDAVAEALERFDRLMETADMELGPGSPYVPTLHRALAALADAVRAGASGKAVN